MLILIEINISFCPAWRWNKVTKRKAELNIAELQNNEESHYPILKLKLDEGGVWYRSAQPAYSSQQCSQCGFTIPMNRRSQAEFHCLWCGFEANADENAASNIAERFSDEELNSLPFRAVETVLAIRFMRRLPDARSASAGLELHTPLDVPRGKVAAPKLPLTVNQPGIIPI